MDEANQGVNGAEFRNGLYFFTHSTSSLCFELIFVRGKLNLANISIRIPTRA